MGATLMPGVFVVISTFILTNAKAEYNVTRYCQLVPKGTKFPSFDSCQTYYTCLNDNEIEMTNCPDNQVFNKDTQSCVVGDCNTLAANSNPCEGIHDDFAKHATDCHRWHYCDNGKIAYGATCPSGQYFDGDMCVYGKCEENQDEVKDLCKIMQVDNFFGDFDNCKLWRKCKANGQISQNNCTGEYVFDVELRMCAPYEERRCKRSIKIEPIAPIPCEKNVVIPDPDICSVYHKCIDGKLKRLECNNYEYFDMITKTCKPRQRATPIKTCDRCEFTKHNWVNAVDKDCRKFYYCKDSKRIGDHTNYGLCNQHTYFNEHSQACWNASIVHFQNYATNNGACEQKIVCDNKNTIDEIVDCHINSCKMNDTKCKILSCNLYTNKNNVTKCISNICDNSLDDICQNEMCSHLSDENEKLSCELNFCKTDTNCKLNTCKKLNDKDKEEKCKHDICKEMPDQDRIHCEVNLCEDNDDECKHKACEIFEDPEIRLQCNLIVCQHLDNETSQDCRYNICAEANCTNGNCPDNIKEICKYIICNQVDKASKAECEKDLCKEEDKECKDEICESLEGDSKLQCKYKICDKHHTTIDEQIKCKLDYCNKYENCQKDPCKSFHNKNEQIKCKQELCEDNENKQECKLNVCNDFKSNKTAKVQCKHEVCAEDILCKEEACEDVYLLSASNCIQNVRKGDCEKNQDKNENLECKFEICDKHKEYDNQLECKFSHCTGLFTGKCKTKACESFTDSLSKAKCLQQLCGDNKECRIQACDAIVDNSNNLQCKIKVCNDHQSITERVDCIKLQCQSDRNCTMNVCNEFDEINERIECKNIACEGDYLCEFDICNEDYKDAKEKCKKDICNKITNTTENLQCRYNICEDASCCDKEFSSKKQKDNKAQCKINVCKDDDICQNNVCEEIYTKDEKATCKINNCKTLECKHGYCEEMSKVDDRIKCKLEHCVDNNQCKVDVCKDYPKNSKCKPFRVNKFT